MKQLAAAAIAFAILSSQATPVSAGATAAFLVIANGSRDAKQAATQLEAYRREGYPRSRGWPRLLVSAEVDGLKPGFHVVAVAAPKEEATAKALVAALKAYGLGAYYRPVRIDDAQELELFVLENAYFAGAQPKRARFNFGMADATATADAEMRVTLPYVWEEVESGMVGIIIDTQDAAIECDTLLVPKPKRGAGVTRHGLPGATACWPAD